MGLRGRLALFFVAITVVPLAVAVFALRVQIDRQLEQRAAAELASVREAAVSILGARRARAGDLATDLVHRAVGPVLSAGDAAAAERWLAQALTEPVGDRADFVVLVSADGRPLAMRPSGAVDPAAVAAAAVNRQVPSGLLLEVREVRGAPGGQPEQLLGWVVTGLRVDAALLDRLAVGEGLAITGGGTVLAGTDEQAAQALVPQAPANGEVRAAEAQGRQLLLTADSLSGDADAAEAPRLVAWADPRADSPAIGIALLVLLPSTFAAAMFGWLLASAIVGPIRRAADVARAVAGGDLTRSLEPTGGKELADLATSLNTMSAELAARLEDLSRSRDQLRQSLSRLGQTLSSSLDLNRTLAVVVETAMDTFEAERGALLLFTPERDALYVKVGRNVPDGIAPLPVDRGVAGFVARTGTAVRLPADAATTPAPAEGEVVGAQQITVPLLGRGRILGVLSLTRDDPATEFSPDDLDAIQTFAGQASGAIENVMLHHEARRLSVTDALTGLWNFRYLQLQADRELESSERFERPMSLLIADLDHFKAVNDDYGHAVGDEVLVEVAARLRDATRVPDVVARYGGEEFVVLLPGTDAEGAAATAERIRSAVAGVPVATSAVSPDGHALELTVTCSVGVATYPGDGTTVAALLRNADAAMYTAKRGGRNRVEIAAGDTAPGPRGRGRKQT